MACLRAGEKVTCSLSKLLMEYDLNEAGVIFWKNDMGCYTFVIGYAWKIPSSYINPTAEDLKDTEHGLAFRFDCNPEIMDANGITVSDDVADYVLNNFRCLDLSQVLWNNGYCKTILDSLVWSRHGDLVEFNTDGEIYYVKDCVLEVECISSDEFESIYADAFSKK